jgi:hypothetical protein
MRGEGMRLQVQTDWGSSQREKRGQYGHLGGLTSEPKAMLAIWVNDPARIRHRNTLAISARSLNGWERYGLSVTDDCHGAGGDGGCLR